MTLEASKAPIAYLDNHDIAMGSGGKVCRAVSSAKKRCYDAWIRSLQNSVGAIITDFRRHLAWRECVLKLMHFPVGKQGGRNLEKCPL